MTEELLRRRGQNKYCGHNPPGHPLTQFQPVANQNNNNRAEAHGERIPADRQPNKNR